MNCALRLGDKECKFVIWRCLKAIVRAGMMKTGRCGTDEEAEAIGLKIDV